MTNRNRHSESYLRELLDSNLSAEELGVALDKIEPAELLHDVFMLGVS